MRERERAMSLEKTEIMATRRIASDVISSVMGLFCTISRVSTKPCLFVPLKSIASPSFTEMEKGTLPTGAPK